MAMSDSSVTDLPTVTADDPDPVPVPPAVFDGLREVFEETPLSPDLRGVVAEAAAARGNDDAAEWMRDNPRAYSMAVTRGFKRAAGDVVAHDRDGGVVVKAPEVDRGGDTVATDTGGGDGPNANPPM